MSYSLRPTLRLLCAAVATVTSAAPVLAQQTILEEVIVTAQKRAENLQDTAISITAIGNDAFDDLNISSSADYEAIVPSLSVRDAPSRLFLRGVGRVTNSLGTDPGVAVYLDQVYTSEISVLGRSNSLTTEQIDILRGPQGTLFGRNATGGAVSMTSKRPTDEFEHEIRATAGNYGTFNWGGASSGPITDTLGYRVYAYGNSHDGYIDNNGGDDIWDEDATGLGAQLSWDANENLNIWASYASDETDNILSGINFGGYLITPYQTDDPSPDGFIIAEQFGVTTENPAVNDRYTVDLNDPLETKNSDNHKFISHITWDLDAVTVKYIGGYFEGKYRARQGDLGFTSNPDVRTVESASEETEIYSHELQLISAGDGNLQWLAGLYYYHSEKDQPYSIASPITELLNNTVPVASLTDPSAVRPNLNTEENWQYQQTGNLEEDSYAAYVDANYSFNDQWTLTLGVRYSYDEKTGSESQYVVVDPNANPQLAGFIPFWNNNPAFPDDCCGVVITDPTTENRDLDDDWDNVSGRIVLDYAHTEDQLFYASIASGYKSGGFRLGSLQDNASFDEEELVSYEIGYKATLSDTLRINASAYFYDYEDMQVLVPALNDVNLPEEQVINADEAEVKGLELEATWLVNESLTLLANYSYIDGEYTDFC